MTKRPTGPGTDRAPDLAQQRFRQIISDMGDELGNVHGWKRTVAERLGLAPAHLSRIISGKARIGAETLYRVASDLNIKAAYFTESSGTYRDYRYVDLDSTTVPVDAAISALPQGPGRVRVRDLHGLAGHIVDAFLEEREVTDEADRLAEGILSLPVVEAARRFQSARSSEARAAQAMAMAMTLLTTMEESMSALLDSRLQPSKSLVRPTTINPKP